MTSEAKSSVSKARKRKLIHLSGLLAGFFLGQGLVFLTQTYLVACGHLALIGKLSVGTGILTLIQWLADFGGQHLLACRHAEVGFFVSSAITRQMFALAIFGIITVNLGWFEDEYVEGLVASGSYAVFAWAGNIQGILDRIGRSGFAGLMALFPWLGINLALLTTFPRDDYSAGVTIGACFTLGCFVTVAAQYSIAYEAIDFHSPSSKQIINYAKSGIGYTLSFVVSIFYSRVLLLIVYSATSADVTGVFSYARSLQMLAQQIVNYVRRLEFPHLVILEQPTIARLLHIQKASILMCIFIAVLALISFLVLKVIPESSINRQILWLVFLFLAATPVWGAASTLGQLFLAKEMPYVILFVTAMASTLSVIAAMLFVPIFGPVSIAWIEIAMLVVIAISYFTFYQRTFRVELHRQGGSLGSVEQ